MVDPSINAAALKKKLPMQPQDVSIRTIQHPLEALLMQEIVRLDTCKSATTRTTEAPSFNIVMP